MQILIDIPDVMYKKIISGEYKYWSSFRSIIQHAILLPEKHGRLIDADKLKADVGYAGYNYDFQNCIDEAPTIIEAESDK